MKVFCSNSENSLGCGFLMSFCSLKSLVYLQLGFELLCTNPVITVADCREISILGSLVHVLTFFHSLSAFVQSPECSGSGVLYCVQSLRLLSVEGLVCYVLSPPYKTKNSLA